MNLIASLKARSAAAQSPQALQAQEDAGERLKRLHAGARVLVAEDNEINREVAAAILEFLA